MRSASEESKEFLSKKAVKHLIIEEHPKNLLGNRQ
jgi:hypothetical protein